MAMSFSFFAVESTFRARSTFPKVMTPTRPIYMRRIRTTLLSTHISVKMPDDNPAVASDSSSYV